MHFETTVEVNGPAGKLWPGSGDVEKWPDWTASMRDVSWRPGGELTRGGRARVMQPGMLPLVWEVCDLEPGNSFTWRTARRHWV